MISDLSYYQSKKLQQVKTILHKIWVNLMMIHVDKKLNKSYIAYVSLAIFKSNQLVQLVEF